MSSRFDELRVFSGNGNRALAEAITARLGFPMGDISIRRYPNENIFVRLNESVREKDVFVVQSLCSPLSDHIMELLIMLDACRRASAGRVTAVVPFFAYGRTDKKDQPRVPITARLLADLIQTAGAQQLITLDLHAGQIQGFFSIPVDELSAMSLLVRYLHDHGWQDAVVVSSDMGFAKRARNFAEHLGAPLAIVEKRHGPIRSRNAPQTPEGESYSLIGDVAGRRCVLVDDEIVTGASMIAAADLLVANGATAVCAAVVHAGLSPGAAEALSKSKIDELVTTDTLPIPAEQAWPGLKILSVAPLLAEVIQRIHSGISVGTMFNRRITY
ncbi:MAG TPA: ribose-phosphate pyrophosphokinase [Roseiflexaceae bacterium]|jgi:ribose-phosphate pyrophosphokinase|nr:ribose-phosphate pyrophosphokinase [Roseiflexaceae bacterium]